MINHDTGLSLQLWQLGQETDLNEPHLNRYKNSINYTLKIFRNNCF